MTASLVVMAKAPVAGRSKTRLCPPCTPDEAALLAAAALRDTLEAVLAAEVPHRVLAMDAPDTAHRHPLLTVLTQRGDGLAERLAAVVDDLARPAVIIGMDTPQVTPALLTEAVERTSAGSAVLGPALDGGWWIIGLPRPDPSVFEDVAMSRSDTGQRQEANLRARFDSVELLPPLRDVDRWSDARIVAQANPATAFAERVRLVGDRVGTVPA